MKKINNTFPPPWVYKKYSVQNEEKFTGTELKTRKTNNYNIHSANSTLISGKTKKPFCLGSRQGTVISLF